jgi:hypothetical protein
MTASIEGGNMSERSFGARWWRESLVSSRLLRGGMATGFGLLGGAALTLPGCAEWNQELGGDQEQPDDYDEIDVNVDALQLQKDEGWDVGQPGGVLAFVDSSVEDAAGGQSWRAAMETLATTLAPPQPLLPYYVPTLFQALIGPAGQRLRAVMRPMHSREMDEDFGRGLALRAEFAGVDWPRDTALVVDAPGPRAVAVAAALSDRFAPVFMFGNWPHPLGVVPAHQTLAATLFYLPTFAGAQVARPADAPPLFVLDANRLAPYGDADKQFDNRYFARLPTAAELQALGIQHVMYVSADGSQELDDLNAAFVALSSQGVDVKMVALGDFVRAEDPDLEAEAESAEPEEDEPSPAFVFATDVWSWPLFFPAPFWAPRYWYRGCWWERGHFWHDYGTYVPRPRPGRVVGPPPGVRVLPPPRAAHWVVAPRGTLFNGGVVRAPGLGRIVAPPPTGFGRVTVRASRLDGHVTGVRAGAAGSFAPAGHPAAAWHGTGHVIGGGGWHGGGGIGWHGGGGGGGGRSGSIGRAGGFGGGGG